MKTYNVYDALLSFGVKHYFFLIATDSYNFCKLLVQSVVRLIILYCITRKMNTRHSEIICQNHFSHWFPLHFTEHMLQTVLPLQTFFHAQLKIWKNAYFVLYGMSLQGFRVVPARHCYHKSLLPLMEEVRQQMGDGPVYISFDIDALDPGFAPGTGKRFLIILIHYNTRNKV